MMIKMSLVSLGLLLMVTSVFADEKCILYEGSNTIQQVTNSAVPSAINGIMLNTLFIKLEIKEPSLSDESLQNVDLCVGKAIEVAKKRQAYQYVSWKFGEDNGTVDLKTTDIATGGDRRESVLGEHFDICSVFFVGSNQSVIDRAKSDQPSRAKQYPVFVSEGANESKLHRSEIHAKKMLDRFLEKKDKDTIATAHYFLGFPGSKQTYEVAAR